jgi:D-alanine-D-alanine ligase
MNTQRVGILMGGTSAEREVSLASGEAIERALQTRGHPTVRIYVDHDVDRVLRDEPIDVAFVALHGTLGEDGCIQGLLEVLGIPYTGPGVTASALAMDKLKSKELFRLHNVPTPPYYCIPSKDIEHIVEAHGAFGYPAFVKPRCQGSSVGAGRADDTASLIERAEIAARFDSHVLVERFVEGRELAVALMDGTALGAIEIEPEGGVYDYRAKYQKGRTRYHFPARLEAARYHGVLRIAERAVAAIGAEGATRVDLLLSEGDNEYVLEVNTLPGMTETSLLPKIAAGAGYDFDTLCEAILERARLHTGRAALFDVQDIALPARSEELRTP